MLTTCNKCGSQKEVKLRKSDNVPVCVECGTVVNLSQMMINSMKMSNDYITISDNKIPFGCKCDKCGAIAELILNPGSNEAECTVCHQTMNITPFMIKALQIAGHYRPSREAPVTLDEKEETNVSESDKQISSDVPREPK